MIPDDCLFALSSRLDPSLFVDFFSEFCETGHLKEISKALEKNIKPFLTGSAKLKTLKNGLGPNWGFWAFAPAESQKTWVPHFLMALEIRSSEEGAAAEAAVRKAVQFGTMMAQFADKEQLRVEMTKLANLEITTVTSEGFLPPGYRPSFAIRRWLPPLGRCSRDHRSI